MTMSEAKWTTIDELPVESNESGFWKGLGVWIDRPHILNKRLCVVSELAYWTLERQTDSGDSSWESLATELTVRPDSLEDPETRVECILKDLRLISHRARDVPDPGDKLGLRLRQHLPKRSNKHRPVFEMILKDADNLTTIFLPFASASVDGVMPVSPLLEYAIRYVPEGTGKIQFLVPVHGTRNGSADVSWLTTRVFPKICQWINETGREPINGRKTLPSLGLVNVERYSLLYNELKQKYGKHFLEIWPERTDPRKFVYQIIAVATYLLVIWEEERDRLNLKNRQSFVDLGCGNGLLTNILTMEGHPGIGIDVKRRKIWDLYGSSTKLLEQPIVPSSRDLFPEYDWIIGSHSDELTPWIPVIAARSSRTARFFLLPCCAHNFDAKFQRRNSNLSIYEDYMLFVQEVAAVCGFDTRKDKLRIPSTKRICFVGSRPSSAALDDWQKTDANISRLINKQCSGDSAPRNGREIHDETEGSWGSNFQARNPVEAVRNCTRLDADLKDSIVRTTVEALLEASEDAETVDTGNGPKIWHKGGCIELADLATRIPNESLLKLKSEFGGLKTLLRNHYHIFAVIRTRVTLRNYQDETPFPRKRKPGKPAKTRPCWFHANHPDGCPLTLENCYFIHESRETGSGDAP